MTIYIYRSNKMLRYYRRICWTPLLFSCTSRAISSSVIIDKLNNPNLLQTYGYINGQFLTKNTAALTSTFPVYNPATNEILAQVQSMNVQDTERAVYAADKAWKIWKLTTGTERAKLLDRIILGLHKNKEDLAIIITLETGKPLAEARGEVDYGISFFELFSEEAKRITGDVISSPLKGRRMFMMKQSIGPAALITPWNFPHAMIARKVAPALAAGCTVVIKPSEETPLSALAMCVIFAEANVPAGVINCITTDREGTPAIGEYLCHSERIRKLSFTGSTNVGKWLMKESSSTVKKVSMELGGNAPFLIFKDADIQISLRALMSSKFRNTGQACIAPNRIFIQEEIFDTFISELIIKVKNLKIGNGFDKDIQIGPLINQKGYQKVVDHVQDAIDKGAKCLVGGSPKIELNKQGGYFYQPTILINIQKNMKVFQEETFGPVLSIMKFKTEEEGIALANDTEFGLAAYFCTKDLSRTFRVAESLESGMIGINEGGISSAIAPFGGIKQSGLGREGSSYGLDDFLEMKYMCIALDK